MGIIVAPFANATEQGAELAGDRVHRDFQYLHRKGSGHDGTDPLVDLDARWQQLAQHLDGEICGEQPADERGDKQEDDSSGNLLLAGEPKEQCTGE
ncbi:hypothetical protein D3C72_1874480 [compost metagenome]